VRRDNAQTTTTRSDDGDGERGGEGGGVDVEAAGVEPGADVVAIAAEVSEALRVAEQVNGNAWTREGLLGGPGTERVGALYRKMAAWRR
jgi:hypothetical protein